jgi:serine protease inhibitor
MDFFYFPKRKLLLESFNEIMTTIGNKNFINILLSTYKNKNIDDINEFMKIIEVNNIDKINLQIYKMTNGKLKNGVNDRIMNGLVGLNSFYLKTSWKYSFQYIDKDNNMIVGENMAGNYFKNDKVKCLELLLSDGVNAMGFIQTETINIEELKFIIKNFKLIELHEIKIPIFHKEYRYKLKDSLKNMGLNLDFESDMINGKITEIIHHVIIDIDGSGKKQYKHQKQSNIKFKIFSPFIFYVRNTISDVILVIGKN